MARNCHVNCRQNMSSARHEPDMCELCASGYAVQPSTQTADVSQGCTTVHKADVSQGCTNHLEVWHAGGPSLQTRERPEHQVVKELQRWTAADRDMAVQHIPHEKQPQKSSSWGSMSGWCSSQTLSSKAVTGYRLRTCRRFSLNA